VELHAHVSLLIASCAPCGGPDGLATGNGSAGITVAESASAAATIAADFIEIFSFTACTANSWRGLFPIIRIKLGHPLFGMTCTSDLQRHRFPLPGRPRASSSAFLVAALARRLALVLPRAARVRNRGAIW